MVTGLIWAQLAHPKLTFLPCLRTLPLIGVSQHLKSNGSEKSKGNKYKNIFFHIFFFTFPGFTSFWGNENFLFLGFSPLKLRNNIFWFLICCTWIKMQLQYEIKFGAPRIGLASNHGDMLMFDTILTPLQLSEWIPLDH